MNLNCTNRKVHAQMGEKNPGCLGFRFIIDSTILGHRVCRCWKWRQMLFL